MSSQSAEILIVDDDPQILDLYSRYLNDLGAISTATDAEGAITALDGSVDVVLLDRRMPGESGDTVLREIRRQGYSCSVVVVSAVEPAADIIDLEFQDYLVKPVTGGQLRECVERAVALSPRDIQMQRYLSLLARQRVLEQSLEGDQDQREQALVELERKLAELEARIDPTMSAFDRELVSQLASGPVTDEEDQNDRRRELEALFDDADESATRAGSR